MPTLQELKDFLTSMGVPLPPDFVLEAYLAIAASIEPCVSANYPPEMQTLIYLYLMSLYAFTGSDKQISSQTAPSGASQSFRYKSFTDGYRSLKSLLQAVDTSGCTSGVIPAEPGASAGLWVSTGGKCC